MLTEILCIASTTTDLINLVTRVKLLLIQMKKKGSKCVCIVLLLKKTFGKCFKVLQIFANTNYKFIKL